MTLTTTSLLSEVGKRLLAFGFSGKAVMRHAMKMPIDERLVYLKTALEHFKRTISTKTPWKTLPVDVRTFVESDDFMKAKDVLYPKIMDELIAMNNGGYVEAVLTGAIGTGKTTIALYAQAYQLYVLSCIAKPQRFFGLDVSSEILIVFQSITSALAKGVDYNRFKEMIEKSPYFSTLFPFDKNLTAEMRFPDRIIVKPLSGSVQAALGQNVIGGIIDEINFMANTEQSKMAADGGNFDQALEMYNSIVRRRKSRFMIKGTLYGLLCLVSSKRYPGEFTDQKASEAEDEIRATGRTGIYVYDRRLWEVKPEGTYADVWFLVFLGDASRKPRIIQDDDEAIPDSDRHLVLPVPVEFKSEFERDLLSAIRDIGGKATLALHPFIVDAEAVSEAFGKAKSIISREDCDFVQTTVQIYPNRILNPKEPRFAHVDLSITGDSTGVSIGHVTKFKELERGGWSETLPCISMDMVLEVKPPKNGEIEYAKIRGLFYRLRELGMNLKWITFDSFQSTDARQILAQQGFATGNQSMDTDTLAYDLTKTAFYDRRLEIPSCSKAQTEFIRLERDAKKGKIDHPQGGSKDLSDSIAGVVYGLTMRREIWHRHNIPVSRIPGYLLKKQSAESKPA